MLGTGVPGVARDTMIQLQLLFYFDVRPVMSQIDHDRHR